MQKCLPRKAKCILLPAEHGYMWEVVKCPGSGAVHQIPAGLFPEEAWDHLIRAYTCGMTGVPLKLVRLADEVVL